MSDWFENGMPVERLAIADRGLQYGDGLFETIAIREGQPRFWRYHMERLALGCERLAITMPDEQELLAGVEAAIESLAGGFGLAKIILTAGSGARGYGRPPVVAPTTLIGGFASEPQAPEFYRAGVDVVVCKTRLATGAATAGLKTLNRLEQVLARSEFENSAVFEGLTLDAADNVICGTMSNVFFVFDKVIATPSLDRCGVAGVMRRHIVETLADEGIEVAVQPLALQRLDDAAEVFLSNSQFGVLPVRRCGDRVWPVGERTTALMARLGERGVSECRL